MLYLIAIVMSVISFVMMGVDKRRAKRGAWRISEKALLTAAFLMGAPGGWLGMQVFRHKTKHAIFRLCLPVMAGIQLALLIVFG